MRLDAQQEPSKAQTASQSHFMRLAAGGWADVHRNRRGCARLLRAVGRGLTQEGIGHAIRRVVLEVLHPQGRTLEGA